MSWAWKGESRGNGWWKVLIVDAPYSYGAVGPRFVRGDCDADETEGPSCRAPHSSCL